MASKNFKRRLSAYGGALTTKLKQSLLNRKNVAFGNLIKSIQSKVIDKKDTISLNISMMNYGWFINKNYKPSQLPPVDLILAWMDKKGIKMNRSKSKYKLRTRKQVAYLIARKIQKEGYATYNKFGIGWFDLVIQQELRRLRNNVSNDLFEEVKNMTISTFSKTEDNRIFKRY